jgi:hypothetical protein
MLLVAVESACRDSVLAVRIPATNALARFCLMLSQAAQGSQGELAQAAVQHSSRCWRLATAAAQSDSDKLRPSGLQALGSLFAVVAAAQQAAALDAPLLSAGRAAVEQALTAVNARVQWAACEAAGPLLACSLRTDDAESLLQELLVLLESCPNFRSRALAAAALQCVSLNTAKQLHSKGKLSAALGALARLLFMGKPN